MQIITRILLRAIIGLDIRFPGIGDKRFLEYILTTGRPLQGFLQYRRSPYGRCGDATVYRREGQRFWLRPRHISLRRRHRHDYSIPRRLRQRGRRAARHLMRISRSSRTSAIFGRALPRMTQDDRLPAHASIDIHRAQKMMLPAIGLDEGHFAADAACYCFTHAACAAKDIFMMPIGSRIRLPLSTPP